MFFDKIERKIHNLKSKLSHKKKNGDLGGSDNKNTISSELKSDHNSDKSNASGRLFMPNELYERARKDFIAISYPLSTRL